MTDGGGFRVEGVEATGNEEEEDEDKWGGGREGEGGEKEEIGMRRTQDKSI